MNKYSSKLFFRYILRHRCAYLRDPQRTIKRKIRLNVIKKFSLQVRRRGAFRTITASAYELRFRLKKKKKNPKSRCSQSIEDYTHGSDELRSIQFM